MNDYWSECFDPKMGGTPKEFERTFCRVCKNPGCSRSATQGMSWTRRMATQMDRLFTNPNFADPNDPKFADIRKTDFPSAVREAMRLEISDRRGDWGVPSEEDAAKLAAIMVARPDPVVPEKPVEPPVAAPPVEHVLQQLTIRGTQGDEYEVSLVESPGGMPKWRCTCKAYEFGGGKPCKHIAYAATLPPEDEPLEEPPPNAPTRFQNAPQPPAPLPPVRPATVPPVQAGGAGPRPPFFPPMGNIPAPSGGVMLDGTRPVPPAARPATPAPAAVDPWAPPPAKPKVVPVGGKVVLGGGEKK